MRNAFPIARSITGSCPHRVPEDDAISCFTRPSGPNPVRARCSPKRVSAGDRAELEIFRKMGVYPYADGEEPRRDAQGKLVKVKWVRMNIGTHQHPEIGCRLVAQELGYDERLDELCAGTPWFIVVKLLLQKVAHNMESMGILVLAVRCDKMRDGR